MKKHIWQFILPKGVFLPNTIFPFLMAMFKDINFMSQSSNSIDLLGDS